MRSIRPFLVFTFVLSLVTNANQAKAQSQAQSQVQSQAQTQAQINVPKVSKIPLAQMAKLHSLKGSWKMTVFSTQDNGESWQESPVQLVEISFQHKGMVLEEKPKTIESTGFHMLSYITYDQYRQVYRKAAIDDVWGIMDMYEGEIADHKLVMTNLNSRTFFPVEGGKWRGFRLTIELKDKLRTIWIDKTDDEGNTWQKAFRAEYRAQE